MMMMMMMMMFCAVFVRLPGFSDGHMK